MPRSTNAPAARQRRKNILKQAKGYWGRRKNVFTIAKNAVHKAWCYAYRDRRTKKRVIRMDAWIPRINAGARAQNMTYSDFIHRLKVNKVVLNRKVLADLAMNHPECFEAVAKKVK